RSGGLLPRAHLRRPLGRCTHPGAPGPTALPHGARATPGTYVPVLRARDRRAGAARGSVIRRPAGRLPQANVTAPALPRSPLAASAAHALLTRASEALGRVIRGKRSAV